MCGGTTCRCCAGCWPGGLSPRVRGNPPAIHFSAGSPRSIPACAGEPFKKIPIAERAGVYPRVCGGTSTAYCQVPAAAGLSPRVRGNPQRMATDAHARRSIPACAGEPLTSPPMTPCGRSIPACAGEPVEAAGHQDAAQVYPRVCGGTATRRAARPPERGLSPRVRGNPPVVFEVLGDVGSIPACAGEPPCCISPIRPAKVYPRVCGGTAACPGGIWTTTGLSPRVRGNPPLPVRRSALVRSIPVCAGEPNSGPAPIPVFQVYPRVCGGTTVLPPA